MILAKKALRSMWGNKNAYIACVILIMAGIGIYVGMSIACNELDYAQHKYYADNNLADVFAEVGGVGESAKSRLAAIDGVSNVNFRLVHEARVAIDLSDRIITTRLVSVDLSEENPINIIDWQGEGFSNENDIMVSEDFLKAHGLQIGDSVNIVINGRELAFNICGAARSPEYVYSIKDETEVLPDAASFSISYMPIENLANLLNRKNNYNDIIFTLETAYTYEDIKPELEDELKAYGLKSLYKKEDQLSYAMLKAEVDSNLAMAGSIPFVFVAMAIVVLYLMMKRVIEQDRMQIATMKAFGYGNRQIVLHYLSYGFITGFLGALLGTVLGWYLSAFISRMYGEFFALPAVEMNYGVQYILYGAGIGVASGILGAYMGVRSVIGLTPAEAMRPVAPKMVKKDILRFFPFIRYILDTGGSMAVRSIGRNKFRSCFIAIGIMFSYGMLAFMASYTNMIDDMLLNQFKKIQIYDGRVSLNAPVRYDKGTEAVLAIEGVTFAEGVLEIPVELKNKNIGQGVSITGIRKDASLYHIYDNEKKRSLPPPEGGLVISDGVAKKLNAEKGDRLLVSSPLLAEDTELLVWDVVTQNLGSNVYMEMDALAGIFSMEGLVTSVIFKSGDMPFIKDFLKEAENVGVLEDIEYTLNSYNEQMGSYAAMVVIMEVMAIVIAFAIIYNTSTISLSERKREYATLRVLGMQVKEVGRIMAFEYWLLLVVGVGLGIPFTYFLKQTLAASLEMDMFTFPTNTPPLALIRAGIGCIIAVYISNRSCLKNIGGFDMVEVLKERE